MDIFIRYPGFKTKVVTFSFDDGTVQDEKVVSILNKYGMKGTFNLNAIIFKEPKVLNGSTPRLSKEKALELFKDSPHEVACHGLYHGRVSANPIASEMYNTLIEREILEDVFKNIVRGMAYPYGAHTPSLAKALHNTGIAYSRTTKNTHRFDIPTEDDEMWWMMWHPTCHHQDQKVFELAQNFLDRKITHYPEMFYIWGHSVELERKENGEEDFEKLCKMLSLDEEIYFATNIEIYDIFKNYNRLRFSLDCKTVHNPSSKSVFINAGGKDYEIPAGSTVKL